MIKSIYAVDYYGGLGYKGSLPWPHHRDDMKHFSEKTSNNIVIMGKKTWEDPLMPKPLKGRTVFVASSKPIGKGAVRINGDLPTEILKIAKEYPEKDIWIIGGQNILEQCREIIEEAHITYFKGGYRTDTKIHMESWLDGFSPMNAAVSNDYKCTWVKYVRNKK